MVETLKSFTELKYYEKDIGDDYDIDKHFTPKYMPWDQRLCLVPNGDIFQAINSGKASVVTDTIEKFTTNGIKLNSGDELEADIIITATGLNMRLLNGIDIKIDNETLDSEYVMKSLNTYLSTIK